MPVDHLIGFNNLMPDKLEMELIKQGDIPLSPLGLERMRPDLGYSGAKARMLFQPDRSKASNPKSLLFTLPTLVRTSTMIATFKAGNKRKTIDSQLFLPKEYSSDPDASVFTPYTEAEVLAYLEKGWGIGNLEVLCLR